MSDQTFQMKYGFFNSVNGDRVYDADDMSRPYHRIVNDGIFGVANSSEVAGVTDFRVGKLVVGDDTDYRISVNTGEGIIDGKWFALEEAVIITVEPNSALANRVDGIFIRCDKSTTGREITIEYREGSVEPQSGGDVTEFRLATVSVRPMTSTTGSLFTFTDYRGYSATGSVKGTPIVTGVLQQLDFSEFVENYKTTFNEVLNSFNEWFTSTKSSYTTWLNARTTEFNNWLTEKGTEVDNKWTELSTAIRKEWDDWFATVKSDVMVSVVQGYLTYSGSGTLTIPDYDNSTDYIVLFQNGLHLIPTLEYTMTGDGIVTFVNTPTSGAVISYTITRNAAKS